MRKGIALAVGLLFGSLGLTGEAAADDVADARAVAAMYYEGINGTRDLGSIPMADDLTFAGPGRSAASAEAFRGALAGLSPQVRGFAIRRQLADAEHVMTFYDLDLGAPGGPIPMAERLRIVGGKIVDVELLFDSRRLPSPPPTAAP